MLYQLLYLADIPTEGDFGLHFEAGDGCRPNGRLSGRGCQPAGGVGGEAGVTPATAAHELFREAETIVSLV